MKSPWGERLEYCHSVGSKDFAALAGEGIAHNHIEISTNASIVDADPSSHVRFSVNVFDAQYEMTASRSRFASLCQNSVTPIIEIDTPLATSSEKKSKGWICAVTLAGDPSLESSKSLVQTWWVAGTFTTRQDLELPTTECFKDPAACATYRNASMVETVYMTRAVLPIVHIAKASIEMSLETLSEVAP